MVFCILAPKFQWLRRWIFWKLWIAGELSFYDLNIFTCWINFEWATYGIALVLSKHSKRFTNRSSIYQLNLAPINRLNHITSSQIVYSKVTKDIFSTADQAIRANTFSYSLAAAAECLTAPSSIQLGLAMSFAEFQVSICQQLRVPLFPSGINFPTCGSNLMDVFGDHMRSLVRMVLTWSQDMIRSGIGIY